MKLIRLYNLNNMAKIDIVSKNDFDEFKKEIMQELKGVVEDKAQKVQWLKSSETASILGISPGTLKNLRDSRSIPFSKLGGTLYYNMNDINQILLANTITCDDES